MFFKRIRGINSRLQYEIACHLQGYCPTLEEIENSEIEKMADRLKSVSDIETLTNVLEWQDRNIIFWFERWVLSFPLYLLSILALFFLYLHFFFDIQVLWWITVISASSAITIFSIIVSFLKLGRKIPIWSGLWNTFVQSISMNFLLENKLGVCRDYAKLTACLLFNIYPDAGLYFVHAPQHVATGIVIKNEFYMLDKQLPVVTISKWHERWDSERKIEKFKRDHLESVSNPYLHETKPTKPNTEKLATEMMKLLNIKEQASEADLSSLIISRWKKGAILYEDNEIVNYSLSRLLKKRISDQRLELSQITKLQITQDKDDLTFRISFKPSV
jgi:predicted transglutaminase-like protease